LHFLTVVLTRCPRILIHSAPVIDFLDLLTDP
jgi:hypothetical protein